MHLMNCNESAGLWARAAVAESAGGYGRAGKRLQLTNRDEGAFEDSHAVDEV